MEAIADTVRPALEVVQGFYQDKQATLAEKLEGLAENTGTVVKTVATGASKVLIRISIVLTIAWILLTVAVSLYATFRFFYLPTSSHVAPIHLNFNSTDKLPIAEVQLAPTDSWLLRAGQAYDVSIALDVPESEVNRDHGMTMVQLTLRATSTGTTWTSTRHTMVRYKSRLHRILATLFWAPLLVTDFRDESQKLYVFMFEDFVDNSAAPITAAKVSLDKPLQLYSAHLRFDAHFTGLRYFMYWYPIITGAAIVSFLFLAETFVMLMLVAAALFFTQGPAEEELSDLDRDIIDDHEADLSDTDGEPEPDQGFPTARSVSGDGLRAR